MKLPLSTLFSAGLVSLALASAASAATYNKSGNFTSIELKTGDVLNLTGNATGKVLITGNNVTVNGNNYKLTGPGTLGTVPGGGTWWAVIFSKSSTSNCTVKNIVIKPNSSGGHPHFAIRLEGSGHIFNNVDVDVGTNLQHQQDGIEVWQNGYASGCDIKSADDAIKVYGKGSLAENCSINLKGNGSAIQFGWGTYQSGTGSTFICRSTSVGGTCYGALGNGYNPSLTNFSGSVVAGNFTATTAGHRATGISLTSDYSNWGTAAHINAQGGSFTASGTQISISGGGTFSNLVAYDHSRKGVWLVANQATLDGVALNFGGKAQNADIQKFISNGGSIVNQTLQ